MKNTIAVLNILKSAADSKSDPKPALREVIASNAEAATLADALAAAIETHFSQATAIDIVRPVGVTPAHIEILRHAESNDNLAGGYAEILKTMETPCQKAFREFALSDIKELVQKLVRADEINASVAKIMEALGETSTSRALKALAPEIAAAIHDDGKTLQRSIRSSKAFGDVSEKAAQFAASTKEGVLAAKREISEQASKNKTRLKLAAVGLVGLVLGACLANRK